MKKALFCLLVLCVLFADVAAQQKVLEIEGKAVSAFDLEGMDYVIQNIPFEGKYVPEVEVKDIQTKEIDALPGGRAASNAFAPDVFIGIERKREVLMVRVPIYKKSGNKIEQLLSYNLNVKCTDGVSRKKDATPTKGTDISSSVLASGTWYKVAVPKRGIFKIDHAFLTAMGVNPSNINPAHIRVYGNGGTVMGETVNSSQPDDLIENAIFVSSSSNKFTTNDYVLFYANGPVKWERDPNKPAFLHTNNYYEDKSYYFITFDKGPGKRIGTESASGSGSVTYTDFDDYAVIDVDSVSVGKMGKVWWSNRMSSMSGTSSVSDLSLDLGSVVGPVSLNARVGNENDANGNILRLSVNGQQVHSFTLDKNGDHFIRDAFISKEFNPSSPKLNIRLQYLPQGTGFAYLDYLEFNYKRPLSFKGGQMNFRVIESESLQPGEKATYQLQDAPSGINVWDITDPLNPVSLKGSRSGNAFNFVREGSDLKEFIAFEGSSFPNPSFVSTVENQNLHGLGPTDFLIITCKPFLSAAEELADFHRQRSKLKVTVALVDEIYNEFSSGGQDIAGIRNFIKMFYDRSQGEEDMIRNVLFFGAASYDYKNRVDNNTNFVPTYQTMESVSSVNSYSTDDFYGLLDEGESLQSGLLDVGVGRIPSYTLEESQEAVRKIRHYAGPASFGPWKNVVSFVADDKEKGMDHLEDCETANAYFNDGGKSYNVHKIYSDAYPMIAGSGGARYPAVNKAINDQIFNGTFLMSYSGHGNPKKWAHEEILTADDYNNWTNRDKLPVIITATCDFGRFDDPGQRSAGAMLMLNPAGGSIAMVTTTQAVYPTQNTALTKHYINKQFTKNGSGRHLTLGEALTAAKNEYTSGGANNHKFTILGDPALQLQFPEHKVKTEGLFMIDEEGVEIETDTIKALGKYLLRGSVTDDEGNVISDLNGTVYVSIFDKTTTVQTINPFPGTTPTFRLQTNVVARIRSNVTNGQFTAQFLAPKDINYDFGLGKVSYYAHDDKIDAAGMDTSLVVGGYNANAPIDNDPPLVEVYIDNDKFRNGGVTGPNPLLYVKLFDDNGINVSGSSLGHDLVAILDDDIQNPMIMNDYYQTQENDYRNGYVYFPLYNLADGEHTVKVKAWDAYNNSGEGTVRFVVKNKDAGFISELYNYPNPVEDLTHFVFQHNQKGVDMSVTLQIFNTAGAMVRQMNYQMKPEGNRTEISWDGKGESDISLPRGVYPYRLIIKTEEGVTATAYQKLVLLR